MRLPLGLYRVSGHSMHPTLRHGQLLVGSRRRAPEPGDIIVIYRHQPLIKRLVRVEPAGYWIEGDNPPGSTDSRNFGYIEPKYLDAVIIWPRLNH